MILIKHALVSRQSGWAKCTPPKATTRCKSNKIKHFSILLDCPMLSKSIQEWNTPYNISVPRWADSQTIYLYIYCFLWHHIQFCSLVCMHGLDGMKSRWYIFKHITFTTFRQKWGTNIFPLNGSFNVWMSLLESSKLLAVARQAASPWVGWTVRWILGHIKRGGWQKGGGG